MTARVRLVVPIEGSKTLVDVRGGGHADAMGQRGAGAAKFLLTGHAPDAAGVFSGTYRSYLKFDLDATVASEVTGGYAGIKTLWLAYVRLFTRNKVTGGGDPEDRSIFETRPDAKVQARRLTAAVNWGTAGDGLIPNPFSPPMAQARWASADFSDIGSGDWTSGRYEEYVSPSTNGETRLRCTEMVGQWFPSRAGAGAAEHDLMYRSMSTSAGLKRCGDPDEWSGTFEGYVNRGMVLKAPGESADYRDQRAEFHSVNSPTAKYKPTLVLVYEPWDPAPDDPRVIYPDEDWATSDGVMASPDFRFQARLAQPRHPNPVAEVDIEVRLKDNETPEGMLWQETIARKADWPRGECSIPNPRQPTLPAFVPLEWRLMSRTEAGIESGWTNWHTFTIRRSSPTIEPRAAGEVGTVLGMRLRADWTV